MRPTLQRIPALAFFEGRCLVGRLHSEIWNSFDDYDCRRLDDIAAQLGSDDRWFLEDFLLRIGARIELAEAEGTPPASIDEGVGKQRMTATARPAGQKPFGFKDGERE